MIIDDEEQLRKLLSRILSLEGFRTAEAGTLKAAEVMLPGFAADVVLCDVKLPDGNGVDFVKKLKAHHPFLEIILLTAFGNIPDGVQAIKNGAFDYITKGNDNDRIVPLLHQAVEKARDAQKSAVKIKPKDTAGFHAIIGHSPAITHAVSMAKKIAPADATVLLTGETGTGKEVFAQAIHQGSKRNDKPFVALNCSAFTKELLEGELFGHKAGAYTGATKDKKGLIETAEGGTLFLDEIGELHIELQAKLLRVLENREFVRLGDTRVTSVDLRIIAATNRRLEQEIAEGNFREDLYYRLNTFIIDLPPLRERAADIPALAEHFLKLLAGRENRPQLSFSPAARELLQRHTWKGNARELRNTIERAVILSDSDEIRPEDLPYEVQQQRAGAAPQLSLAAVEQQHIRKILAYADGNKTRAAKVLGIGLATLYRKLDEYGLAR